ncbi:DUF6624 domain-containing protein [Zunongwangia sp. HRR-M8]|uniref:DUF6624 domain-containing protein n=1 Tax=Zunongwangia sp. HRR-M8 TaxID=3015170 RepID=UPI0022DE3511|nr:DUF6624 domain-containing protein [Zunongwangia sp. HRR-M8]WBL23747.1 hypothetical protein PBT89_07250 [Zunongwangia sp. HRR-M8]
MQRLSSVILVSLLFIFQSVFAQNQQISAQLDSIWKTDQGIRMELIQLQQQGKTNTSEFKELIGEMKTQDSINQKKVIEILQNGWPENLNLQQNQTLFLVIQHADLGKQKKYLPLIESAVEEGKTFASNLALLKDRIALREGGKQIYGSQVWIDNATGEKYVRPIQNPEKVDSLRAEVGLPDMQTYLQQGFQMKWSLEKYYEQLPKVIALTDNK